MWTFAIANCDLPASFVKAAVDVVMSDNARTGEHPQGCRLHAAAAELQLEHRRLVMHPELA